MAPKKSEVWNHFSEVSEGKVKCVYCGQILSFKNNSTSTLIRHMKTKHPVQIISRQTIEQEVEHENIESLPSTSKSQETTPPNPSTSTAGITTATTREIKIKNKNQPISGFFQRPLSITKQKEIDKQLISMITKEYHPFSIVEDKEFKKLLFLLNPSYKIPTRKTVSNSLIPSMYNQTADIVRSRLERAFAVCLTTDGWTSRTNDSFYSVTAHYIVEEDKKTYLSSDLLGCISYTDRHTGENICNKLKDTIHEWKLDNKIAAIVSDNAANMKAAVRIGGWRFWGCFAHLLNLTTQSGLKEISNVLEKIKSIVRYFRRSSVAYSQLKAAAERMDLPPLKLKNDVVTRWNSTFDMIQRVLKMKNAIISTLAILSTSQKNQNESESGESISSLQNKEWIIAEQSVKVLEIFNVVTTAISAEQNVSASTIIFYYKQIVRHLNSFDLSTVMPEIENMINKLQSELKKRFQDIEDNQLIAQATILDPRVKQFGFIDQTKYKRAIENLYTKVANTKLLDLDERETTNSQENDIEEEKQDIEPQKNDPLKDLWMEFDKEVQQHLKPTNPKASAIVEVDRYIDEPILPRKNALGLNQDPLAWWHQRRHIYPKLFQIMKTRLCIMATSVPCERIFSKAGQIINEKRESLKTEKASQIIFLSYNLNNTD